MPGTLYHFHAVAANSTAPIAGADSPFITAVVNPPTLQQPVMLLDGSFSFSFTNAPGASFSAWAAQDVSLALSNWR